LDNGICYIVLDELRFHAVSQGSLVLVLVIALVLVLVVGGRSGVMPGVTKRGLVGTIPKLDNDLHPGSCDALLVSDEAKLKSIPELGDDHRDGAGEILIFWRGRIS
jgi:hypothetical protein